MKNKSIIYGLLNIIASILILFVSQVVVNNNYDDNINYRLGFDDLFNYSLSDAFLIYKEKTAATEPVLFLISYYSSIYISYDLIIFFLNFLFLISFYNVLKIFYLKNYQLIYMFFILSNAYLIVLLSDVHRLKLAILFYLIYLWLKNTEKGKLKFIFLTLSFATHFQMLILPLLSLFSVFKFKFILMKFPILKIKIAIYLLIFCSLLIIFNFEFFDYLIYNIYNKLSFYFEDAIILNYFFIFIMISIYGLYFIYLYFYSINETLKIIFPVVVIILFLSVILNFYRVNLLLFALIYIVEFNRFLNGKKYAILPVSGFLTYNIYNIILFLYSAILIV